MQVSEGQAKVDPLLWLNNMADHLSHLGSAASDSKFQLTAQTHSPASLAAGGAADTAYGVGVTVAARAGCRGGVYSIGSAENDGGDCVTGGDEATGGSDIGAFAGTDGGAGITGEAGVVVRGDITGGPDMSGAAAAVEGITIAKEVSTCGWNLFVCSV